MWENEAAYMRSVFSLNCSFPWAMIAAAAAASWEVPSKHSCNLSVAQVLFCFYYTSSYVPF